jgi:hypothetical protein
MSDRMFRAVDIYCGNVSKSTFYQRVKAGHVRLYKAAGGGAEATRGAAGREAARAKRAAADPGARP